MKNCNVNIYPSMGLLLKDFQSVFICWHVFAAKVVFPVIFHVYATHGRP